MERSEHASELFLSGNNCAQSVVLSFADDYSYSKELALKVAAGFGGGMGRVQATCGAVTGAIMVLGIREGEKASDNNEFKTTSCRELTGCDFNTDAGNEKFKNEEVMTKICAPCVKRAVEIVEQIR